MALLLWLYRRQKKSPLFRLTRYKTAVVFGIFQSRIRMPARVYGTLKPYRRKRFATRSSAKLLELTVLHLDEIDF